MTSLLLVSSFLAAPFNSNAPEPPVLQPVVPTLAAMAARPATEAPASLAVQSNYTITGEESTHSDFYFEVGFQTVTTRSSDGPDEEIDFDEGYAVPILFGKRFGFTENEDLGFAVEIEGIYTDQEAEDDEFFTAVRDVTGISVLLNGVVDYSLSERFGIYGGAGIGVSWLDVGTEDDGLDSFDDEDGPFLSWQLKAGLLFQASETIGLDVGYRFLNVDDAELDNTNGNAQFDLETRQHMLGLGVRFDV